MRPQQKYWFLILCFLCVSTFSFGQKGNEEYDKAVAAWQKKDTKTALRWFEKAADKGNAAAMYNLGLLLTEGQVVSQNIAQGIAWYEKAAALNHVDALYNLGTLYTEGNLVAQNPSKALSYLKAAAKLGDEQAMNRLGNIYYFGTFGAKDISEGIQWYKAAAEHGHSGAMFNLAAAHLKGEGVVKSYVDSYFWMSRAAELKDDQAQNALPQLTKLFSQSEGSAEFQKGHQAYQKDNYFEGFREFKKSADLGNLNAIEFIGDMYAAGIGVDRNLNESFKYYRVAAENGMPQAMYHLATQYANGWGTPQDYQQVMNWVQKSAHAGNENARQAWVQLQQAEKQGLLENTLGIAAANNKDYKKAFGYFSAAAKKGSVEAMFNLGLLYEKGQGVAYDHNHAIYWYTVAGEQGYGDASYRVGTIYYNGLLKKVPNYEVAIEWFRRAQSQGIAEAIPALELAQKALAQKKRDIAAEEARWEAYAKRQEQMQARKSERWEGFSYTPQVSQRYIQSLEGSWSRTTDKAYKTYLLNQINRLSRH